MSVIFNNPFETVSCLGGRWIYKTSFLPIRSHFPIALIPFTILKPQNLFARQTFQLVLSLIFFILLPLSDPSTSSLYIVLKRLISPILSTCPNYSLRVFYDLFFSYISFPNPISDTHPPQPSLTFYNLHFIVQTLIDLKFPY